MEELIKTLIIQNQKQQRRHDEEKAEREERHQQEKNERERRHEEQMKMILELVKKNEVHSRRPLSHRSILLLSCGKTTGQGFSHLQKLILLQMSSNHRFS